MPKIGMKWAVCIPITNYTEGSAITYGTGVSMGPAVSATLTLNHRNTELYGDDIVQERDNGITDVSISFESTNVPAAARVAALGEVKHTSGNAYDINDTPAPYVGFMFLGVTMVKGVTSYETYLVHRAQFGEDSIDAATKQKEITFNTTKLTATGFPVITDSTGTAHLIEHEAFSTEAAAIAHIKEVASMT